MNPQGTPEHNTQTGEQLPTPNPVRTETLADLDTARGLIHSTGCSPEEYNSCTEDFEAQREQCRDECMASRCELLGEVELQNKDISELTIDEAKQLLTLSQTEYQSYEEQSNVGKGLSLLRNFAEQKTSYANIGARKEMNEFQEALIKKIFGEDTLSQGFNEDSILGYNNTIGNHIIDLSSFENDLKQKAPNDWNSQALVNYLGKLLAMGPINITTIIHTFGASQLVRLQHEWTKETAGPAKQKLQEIPGISWLIDGINSIDYSSLLQNPDGFREVAQIFNELSNEEKESIIENATDYFIENPELIEQINLTGDKEGVFDASIMKARNIILAKEYSASLAAEYIGGPEVADILEAIMIVGAEGNGQGFDFSGINEIIEDYNKENDTNYSLIDSSKQAHILKTIQSLSEASMLSENYGTKIQQLRSLQDTLKSLYSQRANLFARLKAARNMQESEAEESLLNDIKDLDREIFNTRGDIGRIQEQVEDIEEEVDDIQKFVNKLKGSLSQLRFDFNNPGTIRYFEDNPEKIKLISNNEDLIQFLDKTEHTVSLGEIHRKHRGDRNILSKIKTITGSELYLIPESFFKASDENSGYDNICTIMTNSWARSEDILRRFQSVNPGMEGTLSQICFYLLGNEDISEKNRSGVKEYVENSILITFFRDNWKEEYNLETKIETDPDIALEIFNNTFSKLRRTNNIPGEGSEEVFKKYLEVYGISEVKSQFSSLIKNENINFNTIKVAVSAIEFNTDYISDNNLIIDGIEKRGFRFLRLIREEYKEQPRVIQKGVENCKNDYERKNFIDMLNIDTPEKLTALYHGIESSLSSSEVNSETGIEKLQELFWNTITDNELNRIKTGLDSKDSTEDTRTVQFIIESIEKKKEEEMLKIKQYQTDSGQDYQKALEENKEQVYLEKIDEILQLEGINTNIISSEEWEGYLKGEDGFESTVYNKILSVNGIDSEKAMDIMKQLSDIKIEELNRRVDEGSEHIANNLDKYPQEFQDLLRESIQKTDINQDDIKAFMGALFYKYITENAEEFAKGNINEQKAIFIRNLLQEYGFSSNGFEEQNSNIRNIFESICEAQIETHKQNHPHLWQKVLENPNNGGDLWETIGGDIVGDAGNKLKALENQYPSLNNLPSISNDSGNQNISSNGTNADNISTQNHQNNISAGGREIVHNGENTILRDGNIEIPVTQEDLNAIEGNDKAERNLIDLYKEFSSLGLERIWKHKNNIFKVFGATGFKFNINDGNYIDKRETNELLSTLLYTTTENPIYKETGASLEITRQRIIHETQGVFGETNVEGAGEQGNTLEKNFVDKFTFRKSGDEGRFNFTAFGKALKGDFSPTPH